MVKIETWLYWLILLDGAVETSYDIQQDKKVPRPINLPNILLTAH